MDFLMPAKTILIKKYENRRLYDATNSRYVNLEEVAQMVQQGNDVQVIDVTSGEDITRVILTQIIAEGAKTPDSSFPLDILRQMVIASGRASQEGAVRYAKAMLDLYQSTYRAMSPALNPFEFMQNPMGGTAPASADTAEGVQVAASAAPAPAPSGEGAEVDSLKQRVADLEKIVSSLPTRRAAPKKAARKPGAKKRRV